MYAVNSLIDVNSSHRIFHNSASESVITFGKKTFRRVSINEETTTQERKAQNLSTLSGVIDPVRVLSIRSDRIRSDRIRSAPVRSGPVRPGPILVLPTAVAALRRVCKFIPINVMINVYKAFILPHLEYCAPFLVGLSTGFSNKMELTNQFAIRTLLNQPKTTG